MLFSASRGRAIHWHAEGVAAAAGILLAPVLLNVALMKTGGAFWDRYCITSALCFYMLVIVALARATGFRRSSAMVAAAGCFITALCVPWISDSQTPWPSELKTLRTDLPVVAASGLTFLEMDRYERDFAPRLFYLVDRDSAIRYANSTIFENMPLLTQYFPIRSHVDSYKTFVAGHSHFLVISRKDFLEEWLILKLHADGARIRLARSLHGPLKDFQIYEVQL
jgi:hypothetical protein